MKGRFRVEPVAKTGIYHKRSPASSLNRLRTRDLARMTAFSERPNSSATRPAGTPSTPNRWNAFPGRRSEVGLHDGQELFDDVLVVIPVPLASEVVVRVGQPFQKPVGRIEPRRRARR